MVYYAGHGLVAGKRHELYLTLPRSEWDAPEFNSLEYDKLRSTVLRSPATSKIVILDCCFSGRAFGDLMADPDTAMLGQLEVNGTYVLASAQRNQVALVLPGEKYTAFSGRLLRLLREGVVRGPELLTIDHLYQELRKTMRAEGLSEPEKRATRTADLIVPGPNRAFSPDKATQSVHSKPAQSRQDETERHRESYGMTWEVSRNERGNEEGDYTVFDGYQGIYWIVSFLTAILCIPMSFIVAAPGSLASRVAFGAAGVFSLVLTVVFVRMARSPLRLEIGGRGVQLFTRSGATWIPWDVIGAIDIERIEGIRYVVAWLREADVFPDSDIIGRGPRFIANRGAVALCSIGVLRASRHQVARALRVFGGERVGKIASKTSAPFGSSGEWWEDALEIARQVEADREQRAIDRRYRTRDEAVAAREALTRVLQEQASLPEPVAPHTWAWVWTTSSGGHPLTNHGHMTGIELRLSYYQRTPTNPAASQETGSPPRPFSPMVPKFLTQPSHDHWNSLATRTPSSGAPLRTAGRIAWRITLLLALLFSGVMTLGAIGATVTGGFPSVAGAIIGNLLFESLFIGSAVLLVLDIQRSRKQHGRSNYGHS